jgi:hypothetical protein
LLSPRLPEPEAATLAQFVTRFAAGIRFGTGGTGGAPGWFMYPWTAGNRNINNSSGFWQCINRVAEKRRTKAPIVGIGFIRTVFSRSAVACCFVVSDKSTAASLVPLNVEEILEHSLDVACR